MHYGIHGKLTDCLPRIVDTRLLAQYADKFRTFVFDRVFDEIFQFFQHGNEVPPETVFFQDFCRASHPGKLNILDICSRNKILRIITQQQNPGIGRAIKPSVKQTQ